MSEPRPPFPPIQPSAEAWEIFFLILRVNMIEHESKDANIRALRSSLYRCAWLDASPEGVEEVHGDLEYAGSDPTRRALPYPQNYFVSEAEAKAYRECREHAEAWRKWGAESETRKSV